MDRLPPNNFDFLRFFLASLVVFSHSYPLATGSEQDEPLHRLTGGQLTFGSLAVDCFFIVSGFLILHSWQSTPSVGQFLRKRFFRIYPAFIAVAVLDAFIVAPAFSSAGTAGIDANFCTRFLLSALRLEAITPGDAFASNPAPHVVNGSLWSIPFEFWCYIGIVGLGLCGGARNRKLLAGAFVAAVLVSFVFAWRNLTPGGRLLGQIFGYPPLWARLLPFFIAGMACHAFRSGIRWTGTGALLALIALIVGAVVPYGLIIALPTAGTYLLFWLALRPAPRLADFARRGDYSYGIYLYSFPILQIVTTCWPGTITQPVLFAISWPLSIAAAALSWSAIEKHGIQFGKRSSFHRGRELRVS